MQNRYYTPQYQESRKKWLNELLPENLGETVTTELLEEYCLASKQYKGATATENRLIDRAGNEIYRYQNIDDNCEFARMIQYSDRRLYLVFRTELYGYGVFDVAGKKDFHYIPEIEESFIWTDVFFHPKNNVLLVSGCIWGCPWSTLILDFSHPMVETQWIDVIDKLEGGYDKYDSCDFVRWDGDDFILKVFDIERRSFIEIDISENEYVKWMKKN